MQSIFTFPNMRSIFAFDPPNTYFVLQPWKIIIIPTFQMKKQDWKLNNLPKIMPLDRS